MKGKQVKQNDPSAKIVWQKDIFGDAEGNVIKNPGTPEGASKIRQTLFAAGTISRYSALFKDGDEDDLLPLEEGVHFKFYEEQKAESRDPNYVAPGASMESSLEWLNDERTGLRVDGNDYYFNDVLEKENRGLQEKVKDLEKKVQELESELFGLTNPLKDLEGLDDTQRGLLIQAGLDTPKKIKDAGKAALNSIEGLTKDNIAAVMKAVEGAE